MHLLKKLNVKLSVVFRNVYKSNVVYNSTELKLSYVVLILCNQPLIENSHYLHSSNILSHENKI